MTTKVCPNCGSDCVVPLRSMNLKICNACKVEFPWELAPGQKAVITTNRSDRRPPITQK